MRTFVTDERVYVAPETVRWPLGLEGHADLALNADGQYVVVGLHITTTIDDPVTSTILRSIKTGELIRQVTMLCVIPCVPVSTFDGRIVWQPDGGSYVESEVEMNALRRGPGRPRKYGPDHDLRVWQVVQSAETSGRKIVRAVADHFGVKTSTAKNWIGPAREKHDPDYQPRTSNGRKPR
jgi:hypothetical protein